MTHHNSENKPSLTDDEIEDRLGVDDARIGDIAKRALPLFYSFKDEAIEIGKLIVFKKRIQDFLMPWRRQKEIWIGRMSIHKDYDSLEDELYLVESDNKDVLIYIANRIVKQYKRIIGREMAIKLAWEY